MSSHSIYWFVSLKMVKPRIPNMWHKHPPVHFHEAAACCFDSQLNLRPDSSSAADGQLLRKPLLWELKYSYEKGLWRSAIILVPPLSSPPPIHPTLVRSPIRISQSLSLAILWRSWRQLTLIWPVHPPPPNHQANDPTFRYLTPHATLELAKNSSLSNQPW